MRAMRCSSILPGSDKTTAADASVPASSIDQVCRANLIFLSSFYNNKSLLLIGRKAVMYSGFFLVKILVLHIKNMYLNRITKYNLSFTLFKYTLYFLHW